MLKIDRQGFIGQELHKNGSVLISELCQQLECSEETIRRDLKEMETTNKVQRIHGGAFLPEKYDKGVPIKLRETFFPKEKQRMAAAALKYIAENEVLMLDSSTTCLRLAQAILDANLSVTIITNSLRICDIYNANPGIGHILCLGGELHPKTSSFNGYNTTNEIAGYIADKAFISCPTIDIQFGLADNSLEAAMVRKAMLQHSRTHFLIADHTKFSNLSDVVIADLTQIDIIITDKEVSTQWEEKCKELHIALNCC